MSKKIFQIAVVLGCIGLSQVFFCRSAEAVVVQPDAQHRLKDSAIIQRDGVWHVFSIYDCSPYATGCDTTSHGFRHYTSVDLLAWTDQGFVLPPRGDGWESDEVWAPTIVERDGTYYMFYTGVRRTPQHTPIQTIAFATSTDLMTWDRPANNVALDCATISWAYWNPADTSDGGACRDPQVHWDATTGLWVMTYSTRLPEDGAVPPWITHPMVIAMAVSADLMDWTDAGYLPETRWYVAESPFLLEQNNQVYLIWTDNCGRGACLQYATAPTIAGPFTRVGPIATGQRYDYAAEFFSNGTQEFSLSVHGFSLLIESLSWPSTIPTVTAYTPAIAAGQVWLDDNRDGAADPTETPIGNVPIALYRDLDADGSFSAAHDQRYGQTVTDGLGYYRLPTLIDGTYWAVAEQSLSQAPSVLPLAPAPQRVLVTGAATHTRNIPCISAGHVWQRSDMTIGAIMIESSIPLPFVSIEEFIVHLTTPGEIVMTLSNDNGAHWLYWNDGWVEGSGERAGANTLVTINDHMVDFPQGNGELRWRIFSNDQTTINAVSVRHNHRSSAPVVPVVGSSPTLRPQFSFSANDIDGDTVSAQLEVDTVADFSSSHLKRFSSLASCMGWSSGSCPNAVGGSLTFQPNENLFSSQLFWRVRTIDTAGLGEWSEWSETASMETPDPLVISQPTQAIRSTTTVELTWTTNTPARGGYEYWSDDGDGIHFGQTPTQTHRYLVEGLEPGMNYAFTVFAQDTAGQWSTITLPPIVLPTEPIVVTNVQIIPGPGSATIRWTTNIPTTGAVLYGLTTSYGYTQSQTSPVTEHTITLTTLAQGQTYHLRIQATAAFTIESENFTFTTSSAEFWDEPVPEEPLPILRTPIERRRP